MILNTELAYPDEASAKLIQQILTDHAPVSFTITRKPHRADRFEYSGTCDAFQRLADSLREEISFIDEDEGYIRDRIGMLEDYAEFMDQQITDFFKSHQINDVIKPVNPELHPKDSDDDVPSFEELQEYWDFVQLCAVLENNGVLSAEPDGESYRYIKEVPAEEIVISDDELFVGSMVYERFEIPGISLKHFVALENQYVLTAGPELLFIETDKLNELLFDDVPFIDFINSMDEICESHHMKRMLVSAVFSAITSGCTSPEAIAQALETMDNAGTVFTLTEENMPDVLEDMKKANLLTETDGVWGINEDGFKKFARIIDE